MAIGESLAMDRIAALKSELKTARKSRRDEARSRARSRRWVSIQKRLPSADSRAIVWSEGQFKFAWFTNGKWFEFDGTWFVKAKDEITVTHWVGTDWMRDYWLPSRGPGFLNWLKSAWSSGTMGAGRALLPKSISRNAQIANKAVFYRNPTTGATMQGFPGGKAPRGFETVTCNSASEVERWSQRQREWDSASHERIQEEREKIEGPMRAELRAELHHKMANSRNSVNREFLRRALERDSDRPNPMRYRRESRLAIEAHEESTLRQR